MLLSYDNIELQLLADGGGAAGDGAGQATGDKAGFGDADQVNSGVNSSDAGNNDQQTDAEIEAEYRAFIENPKFKSVHQAEFQKLLNPRLAKYKDMEKQNERLTLSRQLLASKYNIDANDTEALANAIEHDTSLVESEAMESGNDPEQTLELKRLKLANQIRQDREKLQAEQNEKDAQIRELMRQEAEFKAKGHQSFDFLTEMKNNSDFARLIRSGISIEAAYNSIYAEKEKAAAVEKAIEETRQATARSIQAGRTRPAENGLGGQAASDMRVDISKMDSKSFRAMTEKIMKGQYNR